LYERPLFTLLAYYYSASTTLTVPMAIAATTNRLRRVLVSGTPDLEEASLFPFESVEALFDAVVLLVALPIVLDDPDIAEAERSAGCEPVVSLPPRRTSTNSWCAVATFVVDNNCTKGISSVELWLLVKLPKFPKKYVFRRKGIPNIISNSPKFSNVDAGVGMNVPMHVLFASVSRFWSNGRVKSSGWIGYFTPPKTKEMFNSYEHGIDQ